MAGQNIRGTLLMLGIYVGEHGGNRDIGDAKRGNLIGGGAKRVLVEPGNLPPVELEATANHACIPLHGVSHPGWPRREGRNAARGGKSDADRGDAREAHGLNECVGEMCRANHHGRNRVRRNAAFIKQCRDGSLDASTDVGGGRTLHCGDDAIALQDYGIRVGAADIYPDPHFSDHQEMIGLNAATGNEIAG